MRKIFLALLSFAFFSAGAQTVEEVIQKYAANLGGLDAFNKIKTAKMTGTVTAQGNELTITVQVINGRAVRTDVEVMGNQIVNAYKDGKGWKINPFGGATTATDATDAELTEMKIQTMLAPVLMDYKSRGHQVELQGQEDVNSIKTFKVKLTSKDDAKVTTYYISAADYSLVKSVSDREMMGQTMAVESWYSDPKEINGMKFYMSRTQMIDGQEFQSVKFDKVELDVQIDEKVFDK
ncbi:MAG: hypothetical protein JNK14_18995 [Chitinophagaceae bacterium]|nr:hypothetical protein [Chitinophagaceae bacterium]